MADGLSTATRLCLPLRRKFRLHHRPTLRFRALLAVWCLALGLLAAPRSAHADALADEEAELQKAKDRFQSGQYEEAATMLDKLLSRPVPNEDVRRIEVRRKGRVYYSAALVGLGKIQEADGIILTHLRDDPFYELPPDEFPGAVRDRFIEVRRQNHDELERLKQVKMQKRQRDVEEVARIAKLKREREERLEAMAGEEKIIEKRSRLVAMVPFGVGQFQNDDIGLGIFFLSSQVVMIGGAITTAAIFQNNVDDFVRACTGPLPRETIPEGETDEVVCDEAETQLQALRVANWVTIGSAFALIVSGIIEAQVSFTPQTIIRRKRRIPPRIKDPPPVTIEPTGGVSDTGFFLGVRGRF